MNRPPTCTSCKYFTDLIYCTRNVRVTGYNVIYGTETQSGLDYCRSERSFTLFGFPDICDKQGKYWEPK